MYEITKEFLAVLGKDVALRDAPPRPNLWMNCEKAKKQGVVFDSVENALKRCAKECGVLP